MEREPESEIQRVLNGRGNTKGIEWMGKHNGFEQMGKRKGIEWMGKHKGNRMDGETQKEIEWMDRRKGLEQMGVCRWNGGGCDEMRDIFHRHKIVFER